MYIHELAIEPLFYINQNNLIKLINSQTTQKNNIEMGNDSEQFLAQFVCKCI